MEPLHLLFQPMVISTYMLDVIRIDYSLPLERFEEESSGLHLSDSKEKNLRFNKKTGHIALMPIS